MFEFNVELFRYRNVSRVMNTRQHCQIIEQELHRNNDPETTLEGHCSNLLKPLHLPVTPIIPVTVLLTMNFDEEVDMLLLLGECRKNTRRAADTYALRFPNRPRKSHMAFRRLESRLRRSGRIRQPPRQGRRRVTDEATATAIVAAVAVNPHTSSRALAADAGISRRSVLRVLHQYRFHPFHISLHQDLEPNDYQLRVRYCQWLQARVTENPQFLSRIMFSDEASFSNDGGVSRHNMHYWAVVNPRWMRAVAIQRPWRLNVWCGIIGNQVIGPYFFDGTLTGPTYTYFLRHTLPELLENVPLALVRDMWMQHDGAPPHYAISARDVLHAEFPGRWIGRGGPISWPPRSPDLTPLDFFLWGSLKQKVMVTAPTTPADMRLRIQNACAAITPDELQSVRRALRCRLRKCLDVNGSHFEHLIGH